MQIQHYRHWELKTLILTTCFISVMFTSERASEAQCTQQPPNGTSAVRPGSVVYYGLDPSLQSIPPGDGVEAGVSSPIEQVQAAFSAWTVANQQPGGDGTAFVMAAPGDPVTVMVTQVPDTTNTTYNPTYVAQTQPISGGIISTTNQATITFFPNMILQGTPLAGYEANQVGYGTAYLEVALHEIGHLQGIADYTSAATVPTPGPSTSVVTPFYGVNDAGNAYQKTGPTTCDVQQAKSSSALIAAAQPPTPTGGGRGGGMSGSGGSGPISSPVIPTEECDEYFDPSTNTLYDDCSDY